MRSKFFLLLSVLMVSATSHGVIVVLNNGTSIDMAQFSGKKVLVVNIATGSILSPQIGSLEQLYQKYKDSLVVIAIPSNSFGREPGDNSQIMSYCTDSFHIHYLLGSKADVSGANRAPLYSWLAAKDSNGVSDIPITGNYQKFLFNGDGALVGIFGQQTDPMARQVQDAVTGHHTPSQH